MVQGRPGRPPLAAKREQFGRLIARGVGSAEACRIVGVHRQTGKRWRRGRAMTSSSGARLQYAPVVDTRRQVISEWFLSEDDRVGIADLRGAGFGVRAIAAQLGRSPSTVSRELRRNRDPGSGEYRPFGAQRLAARRRARPGRGKLLRDRLLRDFVADRLVARWSPEQVSQALCGEFPVTGGGIWCTRRRCYVASSGSRSSPGGLVVLLEGSEQLAGDDPFEASLGLPEGLAFGKPASDVGTGCGVGATAS
jgi:hypothetical protein